jgi:signal transduction histidine kinase
MLFRNRAGVESQPLSGLSFRCCEGTWWSLLPNFDHLPPVKTGTVDNFVLDVRTRDEHVGLLFSGFIRIDRDGLYTFVTRSDDGSRLFIGDPSIRIESVGRVALPRARTVTSGDLAPIENEYEWSEIEGTIAFVNRLGNSLELEVMTGSGPIRVRIAENSDCAFSLVSQNRIRAAGVSRNIHNMEGRKAAGEFFVQRWSDIEQGYITPELWALYPLVMVSNWNGGVPSSTDFPQVIHFRGRIIPDAGQGAFLEDASGRIKLEAADSNYFGHATEVLGIAELSGNERVLRCSLFRTVGELAGQAGALPVLTSVEQIYQLSKVEAGLGYSVKIRGVVTIAMEGDAVVVQDATRGISVSFRTPVALKLGDFCEIEGVTAPYEFSPYIRATSFKSLGPGIMPTPVHPTWDQLLNGSLHCQYVELEGVITSVESGRITLLTRDGPIKVKLDAMAPGLPKSYANALVRVRGCFFADWGKQSQQIEVGNIYVSQQSVNVVQPAPADPFAIPTKPIGDLLRFDPRAGALQRIKVSAQIIYKGNAGYFLSDGNNGLRLVPAGPLTVNVCEVVEAVGFLELSGPSPVMREAIARRLSLAELPRPRRLDPENLVRDEYDSRLVQIDGVLIGLSSKPDGAVLEMQSGLRRFAASVEGTNELARTLIIGSKLRLTGVYMGQGGNRVLGRPIDSFQLLLNSTFDIEVLGRPSLWTLKRMLSLMGILVTILIIAVFWIKLLHRKVADRTAQLETQIQKRQQAERQRLVAQERARVAHDLHDDLGAGLTEVNMLTSLIKSNATSPTEKDHYLDQLSEMAVRMVTSLDEIVWAVNPRNDTIASLASYFAAYAQRFLELASIKCALEIADNLPDYHLDSKFRHEVFLAFKEALNNVIQHAGATTVVLRISVRDQMLIIIVADNGRGISPGAPGPGADGLANMRTRLSVLDGQCEIESGPEHGTSVRFCAPLSKTSL